MPSFHDNNLLEANLGKQLSLLDKNSLEVKEKVPHCGGYGW
jgi:hypothetical protein